MNYSPITATLPYNRDGTSITNGVAPSNGNLDDNPSFDTYQEERASHQKTYKRGDFSYLRLANKGYQTPCEYDALTKLYYSDENMKRIQKAIRREIYVQTNGRFKLETDQDPSELLIAMRAVYYDYARNLNFSVVKQCKIMNRKVIEYILPDIKTAIIQQYAYIEEINRPRYIIPNAINVNNAGRRTLSSMTTSWGF